VPPTPAAAPGKADLAKAEPAKAEPAKTEPAKPDLPPGTVNLAIDPWGEVFVNGKSQGVSPPKKQLKLPPGKYKIEVRNSTFPPHVQAFELKSREELTVKHKFQ
jgi:serine/threonine-protein kinase